MSNKPVNEMALAVGGILAGWEIDPEWVPGIGGTVTVVFVPPGRVGQTPATTTVTLTGFHIYVADKMRTGGKGLSQRVQGAVTQAVDKLTGRKGG